MGTNQIVWVLEHRETRDRDYDSWDQVVVGVFGSLRAALDYAKANPGYGSEGWFFAFPERLDQPDNRERLPRNLVIDRSGQIGTMQPSHSPDGLMQACSVLTEVELYEGWPELAGSSE